MANSSVFNGIIWASIQRFGTLGISFISNMVMARLLTPADFGTIGMLMFFLAIAQTFVDSGFGAALIQKKDITKQDTSTVFYINMGMSFLLYLCLFIGAPFVADFYGIEKLSPLLRVMGITILIQGITLIQSVQLQKNMNFKLLSKCNLGGQLVLAITGIIAALMGCGVWSLVIRSIAGAAITSCLLWWFARWRPSLCFSKQSFKELFGFGGFMLLSSILFSISNNIQSMIIGKWFSASTVGNFTQARTLRNIPSDGIQQVIGQVLYPDFSNHQDNNAIIKQKLETSAYLLSYVVSAIMFLCILIGSPLIQVVYGGQWDEAIPYFRILCIAGIPICLQDININVIKAKGHSGVLFTCNLIKVVTYVAFMILGAKIWGIYGFIWVMVGYAFFAYIIFAILGTYYIKTTILNQIIIILKCTLFAGIPLVIAYFIDKQIYSSSVLVHLFTNGVIYILLFVLLSFIFKPKPFVYLRNNLHLKKKQKFE